MKDIKTQPVTEEDLRSLSVTVEPYTDKQVQEYNAEGEETYVQYVAGGCGTLAGSDEFLSKMMDSHQNIIQYLAYSEI